MLRRFATLLALLSLPLMVATSCTQPVVSWAKLVTGLDHPWDIGFLPNGTMLVTERAGRLSRIVNGSRQVIVAPTDVLVIGEAGMLGLAVDPKFSSNGYVFVCMASTIPVLGDVRLVRFTLSQDGARVLARKDVYTGMPIVNTHGHHEGCRPRFGPDGMLWVGTGDSANGTVPQNPLSAGGKVLRLTRDGAAAPGNPLGLDWYTRGHRNVQGIAFRPSDGLPVAVEQGTDRDDEVNVLVRGGNYGWDPEPGYDETQPMTDLHKFPDAVVAKWSSGFPTMATSGATFLSGRQWGPWDGALVVGCLKGKHLEVLFFDKRGNVTGTQQALTGFGRLRQPVEGPDGNLYIATDNGGGTDLIVKVTPKTAHA